MSACPHWLVEGAGQRPDAAEVPKWGSLPKAVRW